MKKFTLFLLMSISVTAFAQTKDKDETIIRKILDDQTVAWNRGDIENFMSGYWQSDSLLFVGKSGITSGWKQTLANYKKGYPDTAAMGKLSFNIIQVKRLSGMYFSVVGKWNLTRSIGDLSGHYTLLFRKVKGKWVIIQDHSS
jgi:ketosteroid isomerase-like protein